VINAAIFLNRPVALARVPLIPYYLCLGFPCHHLGLASMLLAWPCADVLAILHDKTAKQVLT
jgi:hypothetical protein